MAAIKMMAACFVHIQTMPASYASAYGSILCFPPTVLHHLKGAISVHLAKTTGHAVALDELHEMKINRDAKFSIVRPSENLNFKVINYMPFRAKCINNLKEQLGIFNIQQQLLPIASSRVQHTNYIDEIECFQMVMKI